MPLADGGLCLIARHPGHDPVADADEAHLRHHEQVLPPDAGGRSRFQKLIDKGLIDVPMSLDEMWNAIAEAIARKLIELRGRQPLPFGNLDALPRSCFD